MSKGKVKISKGLAVVLCILAIIVGFAAGLIGKHYIDKPQSDRYVSGDLQIHFLELGNWHTGDSIYIKAGDTDVLIDAGSKRSSAKTITEYVNDYCEDGILEYVIATHAHEDHIAGFVGNDDVEGIFEAFECKTIIDFPLTDKDTQVYNDYVVERYLEIKKGAKHYNALQCWNNQDGAKRSYELSDGITMDILYNYYYENRDSDENNYSVCLMINQGDNHYLFTGDLEEEGEEKLVEYNKLPEVELFKAGHHGSKTSSTNELLSVIKPKRVAVCCCAGSDEYTKTMANQFPTQDFIDRIAPYTKDVYVTSISISNEQKTYQSMNGNIVFNCGANGILVNCSNNNTRLMDTEWFRKNRIIPDAWL